MIPGLEKLLFIQNVVNTSSFKPAGLITPTVLFSISPQVLTFALAAGPMCTGAGRNPQIAKGIS